MSSQPSEIRTALHKYKKDRRTKVLQFYGLLTSKKRMLPEFLIIGAQRAGTTSLYNYLAGHPNIRRALVKEVHFFDVSFDKGMNWYRGNFPIAPSDRDGQQLITGEASPYYIFHPHAPKRIAACLPSAKIIVLLRNPIDRAYSHYQHEVKLGFEPLSFEEAIDQETSRLSSELDKFVRDEQYSSFNHRHYSYLSRGIYVDQLKHWGELFPKGQIQIIRSEDFFHSPQQIFSNVLAFLDLPDWNLPKFKVHNRLQYEGMSVATRDQLTAFFAPYNQDLYDYLGKDFGWSR